MNDASPGADATSDVVPGLAKPGGVMECKEGLREGMESPELEGFNCNVEDM